MSTIKVAIVHYHLRGGGVTRIIENAVHSLNSHDEIEVAVLVGEEPPSDCSIKDYCSIINGMSYRHENHSEAETPTLLKRLKKTAREVFDTPPDIWHVHNHSLAKNLALTKAISRMAKNEQSLLLQIHDFAEDGRPDNYQRYRENMESEDGDEFPLTHFLYPSASHVHYAVLNGRDYQILNDAGLHSERLHMLQNPVHFQEEEGDADDQSSEESFFDEDKRIILYPTRGIRRKNLGEFVLWSVLSSPEEEFAITLAPKNPKQRPYYSKWFSFCNKYQLPIHFEVGKRWPGTFGSLIKRSSGILSTSVAEGFGMAFLEPWLFNRPIYGRDLPLITRDFEDMGIEFPGLYHTLNLPVDWFNWTYLKEKLEEGLRKTYRAYGQNINQEKIDEAIEQITHNKEIDFGVLDEELQEHVLELLIHRPGFYKLLSPSTLIGDRIDDEIIRNNKKNIEKSFNLDSYGEKLVEIYKQIDQSSTSEVTFGKSEKVLERFLSPEFFTLLRA